MRLINWAYWLVYIQMNHLCLNEILLKFILLLNILKSYK